MISSSQAPGRDLRQRVLDVSRRASSSLAALSNRISDRNLQVLAVVLLAAIALAAFWYSNTALMWLDELHGYYALQLRSAKNIVRAFMDGLDNSPPLYLLICHVLKPVFGADAFCLRFPSTLGFCVACACMFVFLRRRLPPVYALLGVLCLAFAGMYSIEGRPYGLTLGCISASLVAWQSAAEDRKRLLSIPSLFLLLALAIALHYWSIFILPALALAEVVRWRTAKRVDWALAIAVLLPACAILPNVPFLLAARRFLPHFWSKPYFPYDSRLMFKGMFGLWPYSLAVLIPLAIWWLRPWEAWQTAGTELRTRPASLFGVRSKGNVIPAHEWALLTALAAMPYALLLLAALTTRIFQDRYVLWTLFGAISFLVALVSTYLPSRPLAIGCAAALLAWTLLHWAAAFRHRGELRLAEAPRQVLANVPAAPVPIVIADHRVYMELSRYAPPAARLRLTYLDQPQLELFYTESDTGSLLMSAVRKWTPLNVRDYCEFLDRHQPFLLLSDAEDWLPWQLSASGYRLAPINLGWHPVLYRVDAPPQASTPQWIRAAHILLPCSD